MTANMPKQLISLRSCYAHMYMYNNATLKTILRQRTDTHLGYIAVQIFALLNRLLLNRVNGSLLSKRLDVKIAFAAVSGLTCRPLLYEEPNDVFIFRLTMIGIGKAS